MGTLRGIGRIKALLHESHVYRAAFHLDCSIRSLRQVNPIAPKCSLSIGNFLAGRAFVTDSALLDDRCPAA